MQNSIIHRWHALLVCSFVTLGWSTFCQAQTVAPSSGESTLKDILSSDKVPLAVTMNELDANWRRVVVTGITAGTNLELQMMFKAAGIETGVHYTRGETITVSDQIFLLAYRLPVDIDLRFLDWHGHGPRPQPRKPSSETVLRLSLLNLRSLNSLNDLRPFNAETDMVNIEEENAASVRTLTQLGQGMLRYLRARGQFPAVSNPINWQFKRAFYPYVGDERFFIHPGTLEMYRWNDILSGKKAVHIPNHQSFAVFYEAEPSADGTRGVLFMDGHVERVIPAHWQRIVAASKIEEDEE